jgi:hypothetical protein
VIWTALAFTLGVLLVLATLFDVFSRQGALLQCHRAMIVRAVDEAR